jgi:hypothetical protein
VPRCAIDQRFFDSPYYVRPSEPVGQEAFAVIREAMRGKGVVALGRLVLSKRERVIALEPYDKGLLGTTLRYPYEVRKAEDYFCDLPDVTIAPDMLTLAEHILDSKAAEFDPATFRDRYEEALAFPIPLAAPVTNTVMCATIPLPYVYLSLSLSPSDSWALPRRFQAYPRASGSQPTYRELSDLRHEKLRSCRVPVLMIPRSAPARLSRGHGLSSLFVPLGTLSRIFLAGIR